MRKTVVFLGQMYPFGTIPHLAFLGIELWRQFENSGIKCYFAAFDDGTREGIWAPVRQAIPPESILTGGKFADVLDNIAKVCLESDLTVLHCGGGYHQIRSFIPLKKRFGTKLKIVVTTHSYRHDSWLRPYMSLFQGLLYRIYVDHVIFQCPYAARRFVGGRWFFKRGMASIIPLGVEEYPTFRSSNEAVPEGLESFADELNRKDLFKFIYLAQLRKGKQHLWLLKSLSTLLKMFPKTRIFFVGGDADNQRQALLDVIKNNNLEKQIIMTGQIPRCDVPWVLSRCDCALVPSRAETFGHNYVEPMAAGIPVIGTRVGVAEYAISDYGTGIGFEVGNKEELKLAVQYMLNNPNEAIRMGNAARSYAMQVFSHQRVAEMQAGLSRSLLER